MRKMSKFDFAIFRDEYDELAVSMQRYSKDEAIAMAKLEIDVEPLMMGKSYVTHRAGINEDGEPCVGWWLDKKPYKRSCPVWVFHGGKQHLDNQRGYAEV